MKRLLFILFSLPLFVACSDSDNDFKDNSIPANFSVTVTSANSEVLHISAYLFKSDNAVFNEIQNISDLQQYEGVDVSGNKHHAFYSFSSNDGFVKHPVQKGHYALYVVIDETGKYTFKQLTVESDKMYFLEKEFQSLTPNNSYEEW